MKTQTELVKEWLKKHELCGSKAWWDGETYYNLKIEQIVRIINHVNRNKK